MKTQDLSTHRIVEVKPAALPQVYLCVRCGKRMQDDRQRVYANLDGKPFVDYYCRDCKLEVQPVTATGVTRYVITKLNRERQRTLSNATQGRFTYATREQAQKILDAIKASNDMARYEPFPDKLEVRPCECWPNHFDPKGVWFE